MGYSIGRFINVVLLQTHSLVQFIFEFKLNFLHPFSCTECGGGGCVDAGTGFNDEDDDDVIVSKLFKCGSV